MLSVLTGVVFGEDKATTREDARIKHIFKTT